jgi:hypothetical protein
MRMQWYGQPAFLLDGEHTVAIDPFGPMQGLADRALVFDYAPVAIERRRMS